MKLILKNLRQISYEIEMPHEYITIQELKNEIENVYGFDSTLIKLLYGGTVLENDKTLSFYQLKEQSVITMMNNKIKNKGTPSQKEPPKEEQEQLFRAPQMYKSQPLKVPQNSNCEYPSQISNLVEMGFDKDEATIAITKAKGNMNAAIDLLSRNLLSSNNLNALKQIELQEIASFFKVLNFRDPNSVQLVRQNLEKYSPELHVLIKENEEEFNKLVKEPFNAKDLDYCNIVKDILPNPESNNMNQQLTPKQENKLGLTTKDIQAIRRLEEMGFDKGDVVQVYIMFGRDEERTADFLANNPK